LSLPGVLISFPIYPLQILGVSLGDRQTNDLRDFVGVILADGLFEQLVKRDTGFDDEEDFLGSFFFTAPAVMGFEAGKDLNACGKPLRN